MFFQFVHRRRTDYPIVGLVFGILVFQFPAVLDPFDRIGHVVHSFLDFLRLTVKLLGQEVSSLSDLIDVGDVVHVGAYQKLGKVFKDNLIILGVEPEHTDFSCLVVFGDEVIHSSLTGLSMFESFSHDSFLVGQLSLLLLLSVLQLSLVVHEDLHLFGEFFGSLPNQVNFTVLKRFLTGGWVDVFDLLELGVGDHTGRIVESHSGCSRI